jgi:tRNA(Ile)-lysidine synthase TilS/MesJ
MNENHALLKKINLYMENFVIPYYDMNNIYWWFSLSGGKDSYSMCLGVYLWYCQKRFKFQGSAFTIKQWDNKVYESLKKQIDWIDIICIDALQETKNEINYQYGEQAPCNPCSSIRKSMGDTVLATMMDKNKINLIARGAHLSDTAISYLWRWAYYDNIQPSFFSSKYQPLVQINDHIYLAKPLFYVREFETQDFSQKHNYTHACCMCPSCVFPSRRNIVEESLLYLYKNDNNNLWEFSVPGIADYLNLTKINIQDLTNISIKGFVNKINHIPDSFYSFVIDYFQREMKLIDIKEFNHNECLDDIGKNSLLSGEKVEFKEKLPTPKFFELESHLTEYEYRMIATLGPLWGFVGLLGNQKKSTIELQTKFFDFTPDIAWSQVNSMLNLFYKRRK